jgi:hypothetical protein
MERRQTTRKLTETRVVVHHQSFDATPLKTKDMSQSGVFVETSRGGALKDSALLPAGTTLELTFMIDLGQLTKLHKISATVVRATQDGLHLQFS